MKYHFLYFLYRDAREEAMEENIKEYGNMMLQDEKGHKIQMISIIGEIEGHESSSNTTKTTKY